MKLISFYCLFFFFACAALAGIVAAENKVLIQTSLKLDVDLDSNEQELLKCFLGLAKDFIVDALNNKKKQCKLDPKAMVLQQATQFFSSPPLKLSLGIDETGISAKFETGIDLDFHNLNLAFYVGGEDCKDANDWRAVAKDVKAKVEKNCPALVLAINNALPFKIDQDGDCVDCPQAAKAKCATDAGCLSNNCQAGVCSSVVAYKQQNAATTASQVMYGAAFVTATAVAATAIGLF